METIASSLGKLETPVAMRDEVKKEIQLFRDLTPHATGLSSFYFKDKI